LLRFVGVLPKMNRAIKLMSERCRPGIGNTPLQKSHRAAGLRP
jgi:hypothetical protein